MRDEAVACGCRRTCPQLSWPRGLLQAGCRRDAHSGARMLARPPPWLSITPSLPFLSSSTWVFQSPEMPEIGDHPPSPGQGGFAGYCCSNTAPCKLPSALPAALHVRGCPQSSSKKGFSLVWYTVTPDSGKRHQAFGRGKGSNGL